MGRVSSVAISPMSALGQMIYGGAGSATGYRNVALTSAGEYAAIYWNNVANAFSVANCFDGNDATWNGASGFAGSTCKIDFGAGNPQRIGKYRIVQNDVEGGGARRASHVRLEYSFDGATWYTADDSLTSVFTDSGQIVLAAPVSARFWRAYCVTAGGWDWSLRTFDLWEVTTVGAGNQTALAGPTDALLLGYNPGLSVPAWLAREAAVAAPAATVGIDVAAAGPAQVALKTELDNVVGVVNAIRAALTAHGITS